MTHDWRLCKLCQQTAEYAEFAHNCIHQSTDKIKRGTLNMAGTTCLIGTSTRKIEH